MNGKAEPRRKSAVHKLWMYYSAVDEIAQKERGVVVVTKKGMATFEEDLKGKESLCR